MTYVTQQGDMFDGIAKKTLGSEKYAAAVIEENPDYRDVQTFSAGISLQIPDLELRDTPAVAPPWRVRA